MDLDSVFQASHSRVLRASFPFPPRHVYSSAFLVLQSPTAPVYFPSQTPPRYCARQQKCTRLSSHIQTQSRFIASQQLVPIPKSLWTRRAGYAGVGPSDGVWAVFGTHEEVREIDAQPHSRKSNRKRLCMPVRGECYGAAWREVIYRFLTLLLRAASFHFSVVVYKFIRVLLTSSLSPNILGPLRSCFVSRHCSSLACP